MIYLIGITRDISLFPCRFELVTANQHEAYSKAAELEKVLMRDKTTEFRKALVLDLAHWLRIKQLHDAQMRDADFYKFWLREVGAPWPLWPDVEELARQNGITATEPPKITREDIEAAARRAAKRKERNEESEEDHTTAQKQRRTQLHDNKLYKRIMANRNT